MALSLDGLPVHKFVRVRFRLLIMKTTDGNASIDGPDVWQLSVDGDMSLLHATFNNGDVKPGEDRADQSYPDEAPFGHHLAGTGATERLDFGYPKVGEAPCLDGVYDIDLVFPHVGDRLGLTFGGTFMEAKNNESWGLESVRVDLVTEAKTLTKEEFDDDWKRLSGDDALDANKALWELVEAGEPAIAWIREFRLEEAVKKAHEETLRAAFNLHAENLAASDFEIRQAAESALAGMGPGIAPLLRTALAEPELSPERRRRLLSVARSLAKANAKPTAGHDDLVRSRVDHLLRIASIASPIAVTLLAEAYGRAGADGVIELSARSGRTRGSGQRPILKDRDFFDWQYWYGTDVSMEWDVVGWEPGEYAVEISTSSPEEQAGDRFRIRFDDPNGSVTPAALESVLAGSGAWNVQAPTPVGRINVGENVGQVRVTLEVIEIVGNSFTNLAGIRLVPVK